MQNLNELQENEIWKDIPGYETIYQASNLGNIKSLKKGIVLKPKQNGTGYFQVQLFNSEKKPHMKYIHRLVLMTFKGASNLDVDHINAIRSDNKLSNLEWVTKRENVIRRKTNRTLPTGVLLRVNKYEAYTSVKGKSIYIGSFETPEEASIAYQEKIKTL